MNTEEKSASKENKNNINEMRTKLPNFEIVHPFLFPRLKLPEANDGAPEGKVIYFSRMFQNILIKCSRQAAKACNWNPSSAVCHHKNQTCETDAGEKRKRFYSSAGHLRRWGTLATTPSSTSQSRQGF